jgi:replicative DNA helicase
VEAGMSDNIGTYAERFGEKFQSHILAVAARLPEFVVRYRTALSHQFFVSEINRTIAKGLLTHVDKFRCLPSHATLVEHVRPTVSEEIMPQMETAIAALYKEKIDDAVSVQALVVEFGKQQAMVNAVLEAAEHIEKGERDKVLPLVTDALLTGEDVLDVGVDYTADVGERLDSYAEEKKEVVPTVIKDLDRAMNGGCSRGELFVVLAPPKRGKSTTLVNIGYGPLTMINPATNVGYNVAYYSCEMNAKKIARRFDDRLAEEDFKYKSTNRALYRERLIDRTKKFIKGRLFIKSYPTRTASVTTLRSHLSLLAARDFKPDLVIVDYADIMKPERRLGEMRHEQAGIYEDLRTLAGEYNCVVWTASQAIRSAVGKDSLDIGDFAEAFEKAAIVDGAIGFCQSKDERIEGECRLALVGLRGEEDGRMVKCDIRRDMCKITSKALLDVTQVEIEYPSQPSDERKDYKTRMHYTKGSTRMNPVAGKKSKPKPTKKVPQTGEAD